MERVGQLCRSGLPWLLLLMFAATGFCETVHCQWGPFGEWSECDACTKTQTRSRAMVVYAQFGGNPCDGERTQTRTCETTQGCPLEDGCGNRFRCRSGKCVSRSLVCNGDQDCEEDNEDELVCDPLTKYPPACPTAGLALPPKINLLGQGFDAVTEKRKGSVINTMSFGGQCRSIFSGLHMYSYRLPLSTTQYNFMVQVRNDFSDETFNSRWHYAKDIVRRETLKGTASGYNNYDFHETEDHDKNRKLLILKNTIEVVQFQNNAPQYLPISEEFWKALVKLPTVYNYDEYRKVLERFGTHYLSEGSLGGSFRAVVSIDQETYKHVVSQKSSFDECVRTKRWILFIPITTENCRRGGHESSSRNELNVNNIVRKVNVDGGSTQHIAALLNMNLDDADKNQEMYSNWADSIRSFPDVIKQKLRPVSELVKEVQCAGVKRLYLRRAIDQYIAEHHPCHCQPCDNNGLAVMDGSECKCICKPGTSGLSCAVGSEVEGQPGVIHGSWSCWSGWSSCSGGKRSRSRSCSNPSPQNGGQHCTGESTETSDCEDQELQYLKTMEPQCFDLSLPAKAKCGEPPVLINGYVLEPKDVYIVTSRTEYTCIEGYHLVGNSMLECTADQTWTGTLGLCTMSRCRIESLSDSVSASPLKQSYGIGERITLSCPEGRHIVGETEIICDPSLHFSPDPAGITCSEVNTQQRQNNDTATVQCKPWEKLVKGKCICRMPFECTSSLEVCATSAERSRAALLSVCKLHALQCIGKNYNLSEDSACQWPQRTTTLCNKCQMWETCDDQTNACRCKDTAECSVPGLSVCVHVGENATTATQTMSECEAGQRRCKGEKVSVLSILPCTS
ncbi:complement component C7 [Myripristis murdjan]|uniref:complement component C7 n=1 Tax=Myripristis murdjan TaxID=586833 RepID=UPI001175DD8C|nr:complement component C7-like [Myripristis murdjan]